MSRADYLSLFLHFLVLSPMSIGGAITTVPEMHRFLVDQTGWLTETEFTTSIALAQAAPGPNILFVAVLGWNVAGLAGAVNYSEKRAIDTAKLDEDSGKEIVGWADINTPIYMPRADEVYAHVTLGMTPVSKRSTTVQAGIGV